MGKLSIYKQKKVNAFKRKCLQLYKQGYSVREIGGMLNKPFGTVARYIRELSPVEIINTK